MNNRREQWVLDMERELQHTNGCNIGSGSASGAGRGYSYGYGGGYTQITDNYYGDGHGYGIDNRLIGDQQ